MELQHAHQCVCAHACFHSDCVYGRARGLRPESSERGEQLRPLHSAGGHFTQSNWISRTVDPITSVVTRHWANQRGHRTLSSPGPPIKSDFVQVTAPGHVLAPTPWRNHKRHTAHDAKLWPHCFSTGLQLFISALSEQTRTHTHTHTHTHTRSSCSTVSADMHRDLC